jgi:hypothetical protein
MLFIFSTPVFIRQLWQPQAVVFLHWGLKCDVLLPFMVNVTNKSFMLSDIMLNVIMLSVDMAKVVAPFFVRRWNEILFLLRHKNCRQF